MGKVIMKNKRYLKLTKKILCLIVGICCMNFCHIKAEEDIKERIIESQTKTEEITKIKESLKEYAGENIDEIIPGYDPENIISDVSKGNFKFDFMGIINGILRFLFKEIYLNIYILARLMVLVVLCAILKNLQSSFLSKSTGELAFYTCYIVLVSILLVSFNTAVEAGIGIINAMVNFMHLSLPVLAALLTASGNVTTGAGMQPMLIMMVQVFAAIIKNILIPIVILSTIVSVIDNISEKIQISRLSGFLKSLAGWLLGLILTVFIAIVSLQGVIGAVADGVGSKTAKFAIGVFVPVAGKYLADAADAVMGCTLLIKNAVGVSMLIGIASICILPILKIIAVVVLYKLTVILLEPVADDRIIKCINSISDSMSVISGIMASVAFMFLITITALVAAANISAMIR
ncbi:MAG TPA: stage III sporulation protein AE [Ruminiclostridium sp.]|jgi:stage III sporulation protein AE|uniref:Stage III sporulation protein AE n=2 Tax=Acetivibrio saccincola TaxID=1677857 RepID=A0A2S8RF03_9FIRM|nr:stage III sporulation protein AE [Acetivibrio saccincola]PQQ68361.1 stage III sporulation protein AE [Acetivibrio saccincola]HAA43180.1 stage III sporulation protein AE [Ruminiclostridium sp.]